MSNPLRTLIDIIAFCHECNEKFKGYIKWNDKVEDICCIKCGSKDSVEVLEKSRPYEAPS